MKVTAKKASRHVPDNREILYRVIIELAMTSMKFSSPALQLAFLLKTTVMRQAISFPLQANNMSKLIVFSRFFLKRLNQTASLTNIIHKMKSIAFVCVNVKGPKILLPKFAFVSSLPSHSKNHS